MFAICETPPPDDQVNQIPPAATMPGGYREKPPRSSTGGLLVVGNADPRDEDADPRLLLDAGLIVDFIADQDFIPRTLRRTVMLLRRFGWDSNKVAARLGVPSKTVRTHMFRFRARARRAVLEGRLAIEQRLFDALFPRD